MIELWLIIPAVIIFLLFFPVIFEIKVTYNLLTNTGVIGAFLFKKKIVHYMYEMDGKTISLREKEEDEKKSLDFNDPDLIFYKSLVVEVLDKLRLRFANVFYNIGLEDAFLTSMACGFVNTLFFSMFSYIKNKKPTATLGLYDTASYNSKDLAISVNINVSITLFDLVYSLILSGIITLKSKKVMSKNNI